MRCRKREPWIGVGWLRGHQPAGRSESVRATTRRGRRGRSFFEIRSVARSPAAARASSPRLVVAGARVVGVGLSSVAVRSRCLCCRVDRACTASAIDTSNHKTKQPPTSIMRSSWSKVAAALAVVIVCSLAASTSYQVGSALYDITGPAAEGPSPPSPSSSSTTTMMG